MRRRLKAKEIAKLKREHRYHDGRRDLTQRLCERLRGPGRYHDGFSRGLYLQVAESGTKSWLFRYQLNNGPQRGMGLGPYPAIDLKAARKRALDVRRQLVDNVDPIDKRRDERAVARLAARKRLTFGQAVDGYLKQHADKWTNAEHRRQFPATLKMYAAPLFGRDVAAIGLDEVLHVLQPIWNEKTETANRTRRRIEQVLDWAQAFRYRPPGDNPARWKNQLDKIFPKRRQQQPVKPHASLPYADMPEFMARLRAYPGIPARALEFAILNASRLGEVTGMQWAEVDLDAGVWIIPPARMKGRREHRVPLSPQSVALLRALPRERDNQHVFVGARPGTGVTIKIVQRLLKLQLRCSFVAHGMRATFSTWANETTNYPHLLIEVALAHRVSTEAARSYARTDWLERRRRLMTDWAAYCYGAAVQPKRKKSGTGDTVVALHP
jgi:integrase